MYSLDDENELKIVYSATTDKTTLVNLTNHSYFNLRGAGNGDILEHQLMIAADHFTPIDANELPTGEIRPLQGTPFDFRKFETIGARINQDDEQLKIGAGYDHNWVLHGGVTQTPRLAAKVLEPSTSRCLEVWTTEPGLQLYTGNFLDGKREGKGRHRLPTSRRFMPGDATLCRLPQPPTVSPNLFTSR